MPSSLKRGLKKDTQHHPALSLIISFLARGQIGAVGHTDVASTTQTTVEAHAVTTGTDATGRADGALPLTLNATLMPAKHGALLII